MKDHLMPRNILFFVFTIFMPLLAYSQSEIQTKKINFEKGKSEITIEDFIKGDQIIDYILNAKAGQKITVHLTTSNSANYFNLMAPGEEYVAFYNSSMGENNYEGVLEKSGDQKIRVYLMRSAARRNEVADFKIHVSITP
ncbi:hypothetical protein [Algoriphagus halophilus]|uniref:Uncharacterized protein n=1 Tax=Algoriphagus halophilus TaxID=226505 RepID=A0A1N6D421_9BACT|nr:hypothetical protein [Algoriphagus halophilus]SIN65580.1 hypothetical protein SAMN05444394_0170 [Algoriphagus halophilus]